jgi:hypothetical protein
MTMTGWSAADADAITAARGATLTEKLLPAARAARVDHGLDVRFGGVTAQGVCILLLDAQGRALGPEAPHWATLAETCAGFGLTLGADGLVTETAPPNRTPRADG